MKYETSEPSDNQPENDGSADTELIRAQHTLLEVKRFFETYSHYECRTQQEVIDLAGQFSILTEGLAWHTVEALPYTRLQKESELSRMLGGEYSYSYDPHEILPAQVYNRSTEDTAYFVFFLPMEGEIIRFDHSAQTDDSSKSNFRIDAIRLDADAPTNNPARGRRVVRFYEDAQHTIFRTFDEQNQPVTDPPQMQQILLDTTKKLYSAFSAQIGQI